MKLPCILIKPFLPCFIIRALLFLNPKNTSISRCLIMIACLFIKNHLLFLYTAVTSSAKSYTISYSNGIITFPCSSIKPHLFLLFAAARLFTKFLTSVQKLFAIGLPNLSTNPHLLFVATFANPFTKGSISSQLVLLTFCLLALSINV